MPSPLGEGQTVPLKNRHNQGEVVDIHLRCLPYYELAVVSTFARSL